MGVEEVQKINNLAKELLKHHIASSSEDAYVQAELMVKGEAPKENKEDEVNQELRLLGLKMNSLYSEMVALQVEVKGLKEQVAFLKNRPVVVEERPVVKAAQVEPVQQQSPPPKQEPTRPRTGDFKEKDVEIEKFFYYGKK